MAVGVRKILGLFKKPINTVQEDWSQMLDLPAGRVALMHGGHVAHLGDRDARP